MVNAAGVIKESQDGEKKKEAVKQASEQITGKYNKY